LDQVVIEANAECGAQDLKIDDRKSLFARRRNTATPNTPDANSIKVEGSGTDVVTLKVATGVPVAKGSAPATFPATDEKVPIVPGVRLNRKKSAG